MESSNQNIGVDINADVSGLNSGLAQADKRVEEFSTALDKNKVAAEKVVNQYDELQRSANAAAQAWLKGNAAADAAADRAWALSNGYKEVDGYLVKTAKSSATAAAEIEKGMFATQGARRELMVLGHEAITGNFSRMPGSMMVLAERTHISMGAIVGLGGAFVAAAAAAGALFVAYKQGQDEQDAMNRAIGMTGSFAGQTTSSMRAMAEMMSQTTQLTMGQSKEVVTAITASGKIGADAVGNVAMAISAYARVSGEDVDKVTPKLIKMFADPTKGAIELNSTMHFLNAAQLQHIDILQRSGHEAEAQATLADALNTRLDKQTENVGALSAAWHGLGKAASSAWDSLMGIGRADTLDEKISKAKELLMMAANGGNMIEIQRRQLDLAALFQEKQKEVAEASQANAAAKKITDENEIINLAKQNSELWKKYETSLKIARLTGGQTPDAPSMDAIKADAAEILIKQNNKKEAAQEAADDKAQAQKEKHLAAMLASEQDYFDKISATADQNTMTAEGREQVRYQKELIDLNKRHAAVVDAAKAANADLEDEEARFQKAKEDIAKTSAERITAITQNEAIKARRIEEQKAQAIIGMASQVASAAAGYLQAIGDKNSEMAKIIFIAQKALSIAQAILNTEVAVTSIMALPGGAGLPLVPYIRAMGYTAVGLIAATTLVEGAGGGSAGGSVPTPQPAPDLTSPPAAPAPGTGTTPQDQQPVTNVYIYNSGNLLSKDFVDEVVIPQIRDNISNSDVLIIDPRSRQAQMLGA